MHASAFDRYHPADSPIHRLEARVKVAGVIFFILSTALLPNGAWLGFALSLAFVILVSYLSRLGIAFSIKRSVIALPFALVAVTALLSGRGASLAAFQVGPWEFAITQDSLELFFSILLRSWISVQAAILLVATTTFPDVIHALRHLRVPAILVSIISFMYRYLFVLGDEAVRLLRARQARSAKASLQAKPPALLWRAKVAGNMAGQLFLRSYERSDRIYQAMQARGYSGQLLTLHPHQMQIDDWIAAISLALFLLVIQTLARLLS